jgi:hypothetical protein
MFGYNGEPTKSGYGLYFHRINHGAESSAASPSKRVQGAMMEKSEGVFESLGPWGKARLLGWAYLRKAIRMGGREAVLFAGPIAWLACMAAVEAFGLDKRDAGWVGACMVETCMDHSWTIKWLATAIMLVFAVLFGLVWDYKLGDKSARRLAICVGLVAGLASGWQGAGATGDVSGIRARESAMLAAFESDMSAKRAEGERWNSVARLFAKEDMSLDHFDKLALSIGARPAYIEAMAQWRAKKLRAPIVSAFLHLVGWLAAGSVALFGLEFFNVMLAEARARSPVGARGPGWRLGWPGAARIASMGRGAYSGLSRLPSRARARLDSMGKAIVAGALEDAEVVALAEKRELEAISKDGKPGEHGASRL